MKKLTRFRTGAAKSSHLASVAMLCTFAISATVINPNIALAEEWNVITPEALQQKSIPSADPVDEAPPPVAQPTPTPLAAPETPEPAAEVLPEIPPQNPDSVAAPLTEPVAADTEKTPQQLNPNIPVAEDVDLPEKPSKKAESPVLPPVEQPVEQPVSEPLVVDTPKADTAAKPDQQPPAAAETTTSPTTQSAADKPEKPAPATQPSATPSASVPEVTTTAPAPKTTAPEKQRENIANPIPPENQPKADLPDPKPNATNKAVVKTPPQEAVKSPVKTAEPANQTKTKKPVAPLVKKPASPQPNANNSGLQDLARRKTADLNRSNLAGKPLVRSPQYVDENPVASDVKEVELITPPPLSSESRRMLTDIGSTINQIDREPAPEKRSVTIKRDQYQNTMDAPFDTPLGGQIGASVEVKKVDQSIPEILEKAYLALIKGQIETAINLYKSALRIDTKNQDALFGLATSYHRSSQISQARVIYGRLLAINPTHQDGINNFLVLIAEESPNEAIAELSRLENSNPRFSPIPAQLAMVYDKVNRPDDAIRSLTRAISLDPTNLVYRFNLAVIYDKNGYAKQAIGLYRQLLEEAKKGRQIPGNSRQIQQRLTYLAGK